MIIVIEPYRGTLCDNPDCERYEQEIPPDLSWTKRLSREKILDVGVFRSFCPSCGDGAGWKIKQVLEVY